MPLVRLSRRAGRLATENQSLLDAVHDALVEAFKISQQDRYQQLIEFDAAHFEIPTERSEVFTLVEITAYPGRSAEAKRALYQALARRFEAVGIAPRDLFVVVNEPSLENWSVRDGVSSADVKPSFKLDV
jgi:phenylpyruvate tautomerase PptA (4-oxalocrotonate tautomerase family)